MQILETLVHETVWGGDRLTKFSGTTATKIGHLYCCIDTSSMCSKIVHGTYEGKTIHEWFVDNKKKYKLERFQKFPVLMALVDASENLSVQVHPDDEMAGKMLNLPHGKNESFYIMQAPISGKMINGCAIKDYQLVKKHILESRCLEVIDYIDVGVGSYVYVTGGTLHAATKGSLSFEIEENCDSTFRFYDYDRCDKDGNKRPLQVNEALECLDVTKQSVVSSYCPGKPIVERMYSTQLLQANETYQNELGDFSILVVLHGEIEYGGIILTPGSALLLENDDLVHLGNCQAMLVKVFDNLDGEHK